MKTGRVFYGWWVVVGFSFMTLISTGIRHAVGPFLKPIVADLGIDRASFSLVIAVSLFLYGVFGPLVGLALDRFGARLTASVGTIMLVGSLVLTAQVHSFWQFAVVYGVILPLGLAVTGPVMASGVVALTRSRDAAAALCASSGAPSGVSPICSGVSRITQSATGRIATSTSPAMAMYATRQPFVRISHVTNGTSRLIPVIDALPSNESAVPRRLLNQRATTPEAITGPVTASPSGRIRP